MQPDVTTGSALAGMVLDYRLSKGWTLDDMAVHTGVSRSTLNRLERGKQVPHGATLRKLAEKIGRPGLADAAEDLTYDRDFKPVRLSPAARADIAGALDRLDAACRDDLLAVLPAACYPDAEVRRAAVSCARRANEAGLEVEGETRIFVAVSAYDRDPRVRAEGTAALRALGSAQSMRQATAGREPEDFEEQLARCIFEINTNTARSGSAVADPKSPTPAAITGSGAMVFAGSSALAVVYTGWQRLPSRTPSGQGRRKAGRKQRE